jgi:hypothetical protein
MSRLALGLAAVVSVLLVVGLVLALVLVSNVWRPH